MPGLLSLNTYYYRRGGSDAVFLEHDALFRRLGWDTAVFAMHHPRNDASPWQRYFVEEIELGHDYPAVRKIAMAAKIVYSLEARAKLRELLASFVPDIAHVHCIYHHLSPSVLGLLRERGIPVVLTAHDLKLACPAYKMLNDTGVCERCKNGHVWNVLRHRCIHGNFAASAVIAAESAVHKALGLYRRHLNAVITPSRFYLNKLQEWGWPAQQLRHIPNYVHSGDYEHRYAPGDYLLYFGRLSIEKGVHTLIKAAAGAGVPLRIAGTGPIEAALKHTARECGANVEFLGYCAGRSLWDLVRHSRAVVLPSEWYENAPMSVLEANACGKPVIASDMGGIPELIEHGRTGLIFPAGDVAALAELLKDVFKTSDHAIAAMGKAACERVCSTFTQERYVSEMLSLYREVGVPQRAPATMRS